MNFQVNILPTANRAWRFAAWYEAAGGAKKTASIVSFAESQLLFQFLTPHASDMLDPRSVVPFYELPVYRSTNLPDLPAKSNKGHADATGKFESATSYTINSSNIQCSGIPDKLIVFVRKPPSVLRCDDTDCFATITNISLNFNNQAGLLSSMTPEQLYRNSVQSGLANMSWDEFCGVTMSVSDGTLGPATSQRRSPYSGYGAMQTTIAGAPPTNTGYLGCQYSPTTGTILVLNFAEVIQLTEEYYAPGSLGSFNLQVRLEVQNNHYTDWTTATDQHEMVIIPMNSGVFVNERGTSSTFLSLLTKQDVLDALQQQPYSNFEIRRMVGGGFLDGLKSALGWAKGKLPMVRGVLENVPNQYAQTGARVLKTLGYGQGHREIDNRLALVWKHI